MLQMGRQRTSDLHRVTQHRMEIELEPRRPNPEASVLNHSFWLGCDRLTPLERYSEAMEQGDQQWHKHFVLGPGWQK